MVRSSRPGFLEGFAVFCPIPADSRRFRGQAAKPCAVVPRRSDDSCWRPEPTRRDAGQALEVAREVALVREASACGNLGQGEVAFLSKELLCTLDAAGDDVL